tara:strand:- start:846 stop:1511 length:666 start_codon:yes stop_codon:yes gene_type:complete
MKPVSSSQIGGKGSVRRKVFNKHKRFHGRKKSKDELHYELRIKRINNYISEINDEYIELAKENIDEVVYTYFNDVKRYDMKDKEEFKIFKHDYNDYFDSKLLNMNNFKIKTDSYVILQKLFINDCMPHILDLFNTIEIILEKKEYEKQGGDIKEMTDKECFDILGLDVSITPTKKDLRKVFREKSFMYHPDKQKEENKEDYTEKFKKISVAYKLVKKRYNL